ncbi:MAG: hypothetical protein SCI24_04425, partial [Halomonas sp.]
AWGLWRATSPSAMAMLCAENPRPVGGGEGVADPGSRAEAWQYRTLMRDQWRTTPGALDWLQARLDG